jgi:hypothetical protein
VANETERIENGPPSIGISDLIYRSGTLFGLVGVLLPRGTIIGYWPAFNFYKASLPGAGDGSEIPIGVLGDDVLPAATSTRIRFIVGGTVRLENLVRFGGSVDFTVRSQLRSVGITPLSVAELTRLDN